MFHAYRLVKAGAAKTSTYDLGIGVYAGKRDRIGRILVTRTGARTSGITKVNKPALKHAAMFVVVVVPGGGTAP